MVEPLRNHKVQRDLKVARDVGRDLKRVRGWIDSIEDIETISDGNIVKLEKQSDCILCSSCPSACPIFEVNVDFIAPFAFTRAYRYLLDVREGDKRGKIDSIQQNGVWDCPLWSFYEACPQNIDIKSDI